MSIALFGRSRAWFGAAVAVAAAGGVLATTTVADPADQSVPTAALSETAQTSSAQLSCRISGTSYAPVTVRGRVDLPNAWPIGEPTPSAGLEIDVPLNPALVDHLRSRGGVTLESAADPTWNSFKIAKDRGRDTAGQLIASGLTLPKVGLSSTDGSSLLTFSSTVDPFPVTGGAEPSPLTTPRTYATDLSYDDLRVQLVLRDASGRALEIDENGIDGGGTDADPWTFELRCVRQEAPDSGRLAWIVATYPAPAPPTVVELTDDDISETWANIRWGLSPDEGTDKFGGYVVRVGDHTYRFGPGKTSLSPVLQRGTAYRVTVSAIRSSTESTPVVYEFTTKEACGCRPAKPTDLQSVVGETSVALFWKAPEGKPAAVAYDIRKNGTVVGRASGTSYLAKGLTAATTYEFTVEAVDGEYRVGPPSDVVKVTTLPASLLRTTFGVKGTAGLKTLVRGSIPVTGSFVADTALDGPDGFEAQLTLANASARLATIGGWLPLTGKLFFAFSGPTTGKLVDGVLTTNSKVRIKVGGVKMFGAIPLATPNSCQTRQLTDLTMVSTGAFSAATGGTLTGTFRISDLNGCAALAGLFSPVSATADNTISLTLTRAAAPAPAN